MKQRISYMRDNGSFFAIPRQVRESKIGLSQLLRFFSLHFRGIGGVLLCLLLGCQDDPVVRPDTGGGNDVSLILRIPALDIPATRTMDGVKEYEVKEAVVLVFKVDGSNNETFAYYKQGTTPVMSGSGNTYTAEFRASLTEGADYNIAVIANPDATLKSKLGTFTTTDSKAYVLGELTYTHAGKWPADGSGTYTPIPMYGETGKTNIVGNTNTAITLTRMLARIDVAVDLGSNPENTFRLSNVYLCNYNTVGLVATGASATTPNIPGSPGKQAGQSTALNFTVNGATDISASYTGEIYTFEAAAAVESTETNFYNSVCLVLRGRFNGETTDSYYRVNFTYDGDVPGGTKGEYMPLLRNYKYEVKVTEVRRVGYGTLNEAIQSYGIESNDKLKYKTVTYNLGEITDMVFDGQYLLGTDARNRILVVGPAGVTSKTFTVYTDYPQGYSVEKVYDVKTNTTPTWLTYTSPGGTGTRQIELNAQPANNPREANMILRAGRLRDTITISQKMGSNCYILLPGEEVEIPVYSAYQIWKEYPDIINKIDLSYTTPTAKLLWKDVMGNIIENQTQLEVTGSGAESLIRVKAGTVTGNAVIAMYTDNGATIRWSWHIWVVDPDDPPKALGGSGPNNLAWLDRNLGAMNSTDPSHIASMGFLYQWGRKDPFINAASVSLVGNDAPRRTMYDATDNIYTYTTTARTTQLMLETSIMRPSTFITSPISGTSSQVWYSSATGANMPSLWSNSGEKTVFDPCPDGYQVPNYINNGNESPWFDILDTPGLVKYHEQYGGQLTHTNYYAAVSGGLAVNSRSSYLWATNDTLGGPIGKVFTWFTPMRDSPGYWTMNSNALARYSGNGLAIRCQSTM